MARHGLLIFAFAAIVASVALGYFARTSPGVPTAPLTADPPICDLGTVQWGALHGTFEVLNTSEKPIEVRRLTKSCDCTDVTMRKSNLAPGERAKIEYVWNTQGKRGDDSTFVDVIYADPESDTERGLQVEIRGVVTPEFDFSPRELDFAGQQPESREVTFKAKEPGFRIESAHCSHRSYQATVSADAQSVTVSFDPSKMPPEEWSACQVTITTNNAIAPVCHIPVFLTSAHPDTTDASL